MDFDLVSQTKVRTIEKFVKPSIHNMEFKSTRSPKLSESFMSSNKIKLPGSRCLRQYMLLAEKRKKRFGGGSIRKSSLAFGISKCASQEVSRDNLIMAEKRPIAAKTKILAQSASCLVEQNESNCKAQENI